MAIKISGSTIIDDSRQLVNVGVSTLSSLQVTNNITANGNIVGDDSTNISGINSVTATKFVKSSGTSTQFLKADGSVDTSTYLTAESDTLDDVLGRGNSSTKGMNVGISTLGNVSSGFVKLYNNSNLVFETVGTGVSVSNAGLNTATIFGPPEIIIDPHPVGVATTSGIVRIKGDLYVDGKNFIIDSETITLGDFVVGIASTATTDSLADGAGLLIGPDNTFKYEYNSGTNPSLKSSENLNVSTGKVYQINQTEVLSADTLSVGTGATVHSPGSNIITLGTNDEERLRIASNGDVHLGDWGSQSTVYGKARLNIRGADEIATSFNLANSYLHIGGQESTLHGLYPISFGHTKAASTKASSYIGAKVTDAGSYEKTALVFATRDATTDTEPDERLRIDSSGNVLVGTTDATVYNNSGSGNDGIVLRGGNVIDIARSNDLQLTLNRLASDGSMVGFYRDGTHKATINIDNSALTIGMPTAEALRITSGGNIGIGTDNPSEKLSIENGNIFIRDASDNESYIYFTHSPIANRRSYIGAVEGTGNSNSLVFATNADGADGVEKLRITSAGSVGIATVTPQGNVNIHGSANDDVKLYLTTPIKTKTRIGYLGLSNRFGMDVENGFQIRDAAASYATRILISSTGALCFSDTADDSADGYGTSGQVLTSNGNAPPTWQAAGGGGGSGSGISTISGVVNIADDLDVDGHTELDNANITGVTTFASNLTISGDGSNNSLITESGAGNLFIKADDAIFNNAAGDTFLGKFNSDGLTIPGNIVHSSDTNTTIGFPGNDAFTVTTAGYARMEFSGDYIYLNGQQTGNNRGLLYNYAAGLGFYGSVSSNASDQREITFYTNGNTQKVNINSFGVNMVGITTVTDTLKVGTAITAHAGIITTNSVYGKLNNLTYPTANGTDGQVLTSDGAGVVQWEDAPGAGGGISGITIENDGSALSTLATTLNFTGAGVVASGTGAEKTITISGGGGGGGASGLWASNATGINTSTNVGIATTTASAMLEIGSSGIATATTMINAKAWDGQTFNVDGNITSGSIFAVNDISGLPVVDYNATHGLLSLAPFGGNVSIGYTNSGTKLGLKGSTSERVYIVADELSDQPSDTINIDNGNVQYFTTAEDGGTLTANITSNNTLNADLAIGDSVTVVVIIKPDSTSDNITNITIDGSAATEEWLGGTAPSGGANGTYDVYTFFILKTADATFLPLCNKVNFA